MIEDNQNVEHKTVSQTGVDSAVNNAKESLVADAHLSAKNSQVVAHGGEVASYAANQVLPKFEIGGTLSNDLKPNYSQKVVGDQPSVRNHSGDSQIGMGDQAPERNHSVDSRIVMGDQPSDRNHSSDLRHGDLQYPKFLNGEAVFRTEGVHKLGTGDYFVDEGGKQTIFTPNGDHVTVNPDGSSSIKGDISKMSTDANGVTTVELRDGATVKFDKSGITEVDRDGRSVSICDQPVMQSFPFPPGVLLRQKVEPTGWGSGYDGTPGTCPPGDMC